MYEAAGPLDNEEVKALYSHTAWQAPQDDAFAAEVNHLLLTSLLPACMSLTSTILAHRKGSLLRVATRFLPQVNGVRDLPPRPRQVSDVACVSPGPAVPKAQHNSCQGTQADV